MKIFKVFNFDPHPEFLEQGLNNASKNGWDLEASLGDDRGRYVFLMSRKK